MIVLVNEDSGEKTIGEKRNELIQEAVNLNSHSIAFIDDDDMPGKTYVENVLKGMRSGADCCSLKGQIYFGKQKGKPFLHSIKYKEWAEDSRFYYRCTNHLNAVKLELVKDIPFQKSSFGEDGNWSYDLRDTGRLKTEYEITDVIYHYFTGKKDFNWETQLYKYQI